MNVPNDVVVVAVVLPVVSLGTLWAARRFGQWVLNSVQHSFGQVVVEVMAPDMAHLGTKLSSALEELNATNAAEHAKVQGRLSVVDERLSDVEKRLELVESKLNIRPPNARTRATDTPTT